MKCPLQCSVPNWTADAGKLLMRAMLCVVFVYHGSQKLFSWFGGNGMEGFQSFLDKLGVPFPHISAYLAAGTEFFGGIALLVGVLTRLVTIPMAFNMFIAAFMVHGAAFSNQQKGMEYPLTLAVMIIALGLLGPGAISLDRFIFGQIRDQARAKQ